jgi:hypothetical protein
MDHAANIGAKILSNVLEAGFSTVILDSVMKKGRDDHVLCNWEIDLASLAHHKRGDPKKMGHGRDIRPLAKLDVQMPRVIDSTGEPVCQAELLIGHARSSLSSSCGVPPGRSSVGY